MKKGIIIFVYFSLSSQIGDTKTKDSELNGTNHSLNLIYN